MPRFACVDTLIAMNILATIFIPLFVALTAIPVAPAPLSARTASFDYKLASAVGEARGKLNIIGGITGLGRVDVSSDAGLYEKIAAIINILLGFAGVIATIYIIVAGIRWITASGNEEDITKAKGTIRNAVIGIVVVLGAYVLINFVIGELIGIFTS